MNNRFMHTPSIIISNICCVYGSNIKKMKQKKIDSSEIPIYQQLFLRMKENKRLEAKTCWIQRGDHLNIKLDA